MALTETFRNDVHSDTSPHEHFSLMFACVRLCSLKFAPRKLKKNEHQRTATYALQLIGEEGAVVSNPASAAKTSSK